MPMPYVKRDASGKIIALFDRAGSEALEKVSTTSEELLEFLNESGEDSVRVFLESTDRDLIRVLEDLINLLIEQRIILFTDLPESAQQKLLSRRQAREKLSDSNSPVIDSEDII